MTLGLAPEPNDAGRLVAVAVDAAGAGGSRPYTYAIPAELDDVEDGEAVLVPFGKRQALGVILGPATAEPGVTTRPIADRIRADGPLLPALSLALARWIAEHYLAPPALVVRSMLPPGLLERLELVAERAPAAAPDAGADEVARDAADADILDQLEAGARPARDLAAPDGRAGLMRRLRSLADAGRITLDWTLLGASAGPRYERWVGLTASGRATARDLAADRRPPGRTLGPRQVAVLEELAGSGGEASGPELGARHGSAALASLVRRGLLASESRERPRRPLATRKPGVRGGRPRASDLSVPQTAAVD